MSKAFLVTFPSGRQQSILVGGRYYARRTRQIIVVKDVESAINAALAQVFGCVLPLTNRDQIRVTSVSAPCERASAIQSPTRSRARGGFDSQIV